MATDPNDPHMPVSNLARESRPTEEQVSDPETGSEAGVAEPDGEIEFGARPPTAMESAALGESLKAPDTTGLMDIGAASFESQVVLETVHGKDNRIQIAQTTQFPFRAIASLLITARDGTQYVGTAWFISPRTLITAGHCVYIKNSGRPNRDGWVKSIEVMPGRSGSNLPYGSVTSSQFWTVKGWADRGDENYDYAAIIIPTELGSKVGWFGYGAFPDGALMGPILNVTGYPADKDGGATLWHDSKAAAALSSTKIHYDIDTHGGQSGAAVYMIRDGKRYAVAVHAYGGATTNSGTRISDRIYKNFDAWKR